MTNHLLNAELLMAFLAGLVAGVIVGLILANLIMRHA